jgi:hypothetical protein
MLHLELYRHGTRDFIDWLDPQKDMNLLDPSLHLFNSKRSPNKWLTWDNSEGKESVG